MSIHLPGPGPQVATGRLRVDAGRAIAKLREYQLADRTTWILEAIRAAVASSATDISLTGDANDIWLVWQGEPWPVELLPRLFDELVSPSTGADVQHVRLLAAAVNSALGMDPAYVDVYAVPGDGTAQVVRYTPDVLAEPEDELGESRLRHVAAKLAKAPDGAKRGMIVHLRRKLSLDLISNWLGHPPELAVADQACRNIVVPFHVLGRTHQRSVRRDVLRVPLGEGVDGFISVFAEAIEKPTLVVAEHGVVLARYGLGLDDEESTGALPVHVFVDAPHMPTNASRSQVRRDKHPISTAQTAAHKLMPDVIAKLGELAASGDEKARAAALAWIGARIGGAQWHVQAASIHGALREVAKQHLIRNAVGEPRPVATHWAAQVHTGKEPYPRELGAWLGDVAWFPPGDAANGLLAGVATDTRAMRRLARWAKRQAAAQRKFYAHAKREAKVSTEKKPRVRLRLATLMPDSAVENRLFADLTGEVAVYTQGAGATLTILLEGRELERVPIDCPIRVDAVIDSARVKPADRYRGVERDSEFGRVERAFFGAVIRAIEALVLARTGATVDCEVGPEDGKAADARLFRTGLALLRDQHIKIKGPLASAPLWETTEGTWVGPGDLRGSAIGVATPGEPVNTPKGRVVIYADEDERLLIGKSFGGRLVNYDRTAGTLVPDEFRHAANLVNGRPCALALRDGDLVGAIAPASKSTIQLHHCGAALKVQPRKGRYLDTAIIVSSDAIVPDTDWKTAFDDAGLLQRDYGSWELALIRAIARAVGGELKPELRVPGTLEIDSPLGLALCEALVAGTISEMLDLELVTALRKAPLLRVNGRKSKLSINEFVALHGNESRALPVIPQQVELVGDFAPLVAPDIVGQAVAKLVGRKSYDASGEVVRRQRRAIFERNYAVHCAKPEEPIALDTAERVAVTAAYSRGYVGVSEREMCIRVYVEKRWFQTIYAPDMLPLIAVVEVAAEHCGETFSELPEATIEKIKADVVRAVPALLVEIATHRPKSIVETGRVRQLLTASLVRLDDDTRAKLAAVPAFRTLQGEPISLDTASHPHNTIRVARWQDSWLGPEEGQPVTTLDEPILALTEDAELLEICKSIVALPIVDVTDEVVRLQAQRRMARGLLPTPKVNGVSADLKRKLADLGEAGKKLGHGEMALVTGDDSSLLLHSYGRFVRSVPIKVTPPISLAIEDQEIGSLEDEHDIQKMIDSFLDADGHPLTKVAQQLAVELTRQVLATPAGRALLTVRMLRNLASAVLARTLRPAILGDLAAFETIDGTSVTWDAVAKQVELFEDVWAVAEHTDDRPLDERRIVLQLREPELALGRSAAVPLVPALKELSLDMEARRNRARPPVPSLALATRQGVFAEVELGGDGVTAPRGTVAVLLPSMAGARGIDVHHAMQPLGRMNDPCAWPTLAVVDDARLTPNRTWSEPKPDQVWQAVAKAVRAASEQALELVGAAPADALVMLRVGPDINAEIKELRRNAKAQVRGLVWLVGAPGQEPAMMQLTHPHGVLSYAPDHGVAIGGQLLLHSAGEADLRNVLAQLAGHVHGPLVKGLIAKGDVVDAGLVAAHVAKALSLETLKPNDVRGFEFKCFAPYSLDARALVSMLRKHHQVPVVAPGETFPGETALVDDGSPVYRVILGELGQRAHRAATIVAPVAAPQPVKISLPGLPPARAPEPTAPPPKPQPKFAPPPKKREPEPEHPLQGLMEAVSKRVGELGLRGYAWTIIDEKQPMIRFEHSELFVAGNNPKLRALAALPDTSPFRLTGIDAIAAHAVSLLNIALTEITDASEMAAIAALLARSPRA